MAIVDHTPFRIFRGQKLYDDEQPLDSNTPDFDFPRPVDDPAPYIVVVQGPRNVGKSLLIRSLVKEFTERTPLSRTTHSIPTLSLTTASGKEIRLQFVECPDDINGMVDAAKYADVAILMVDASYGFEMETFEFRNLLQVHGFPKVIGVLTHLDKVSLHEVSKVRKRIEDHFCTEIYEGAKVSSLFGLEDGMYRMSEIDHLREMLSDSKFLPLSWRAEHPYVLVDHFEQLDRSLSLYGYLRGCDIKKGAKVHVAGVGDFTLAGVTRSMDPCPLKVDSFGDFDLPVEQGHIKGCKTGTYLRLDVHDVPPTIVVGAHHPILVGGILPENENSDFMMVKLRRHSWHNNLLMSGVPITISVGWRRYQTNAIYAMENKNRQHRLLEYSPEHKDCLALFWGPPAPAKTRIVAVLNRFYSLKDELAFRIMAKGVVLDFDHDALMMLEGKRMGTFVQTNLNTTYFKFAARLRQSDRFTGAPIQTSSGIRGKIGKPAKWGMAECTFEDNIRMGDTFFFPVSPTLMLPPLLQGLKVFFDAVDYVPDCEVRESYEDLLYDAAGIIENSTIRVIPLCSSIRVDHPVDVLEKLLAVSYKKVAPRRPYLRRGVLIREGECAYLSLLHPLEMERREMKEQREMKKKKHQENKRKHQELHREMSKGQAHEEQISGEGEIKHSLDRSGEEAKEKQISEYVEEKHSLDRSGEEKQISGEENQISVKVERKHSSDRSGEVVDDDESVLWCSDRAIELFLQRYGGQISRDVKKKHSLEKHSLDQDAIPSV